MDTMKIESVDVYAKLNYLRDKTSGVLEPDEMWADLRDQYLKEAREVPEYILTDEEVGALLAIVEKESRRKSNVEHAMES
jgi:hypothetical protein